MPGLPVVFTRVSPLGAAIIVPAPFSTVITRYVCAKTRAVCKRSARSSAMVRPFRRHISPGCGVMMTGACGTSSFSGVLARIFSASASRTTVPCAFSSTASTSFAAYGAVPSPQPTRHALALSIASSTASPGASVGSYSVKIASGTAGAKIGYSACGMAMFKSPTPLRSAARAAMMHAPAMPTLPQIIKSRPYVPLCPSGSRFGNSGQMLPSKTDSVSHGSISRCSSLMPT